MRARRQVCGSLAAVAVAVGTLAVGGSTVAQAGPGGPRYTAGAAGAGDAYFPFAGNGGYDVQHYDLDLTYTPPAPCPGAARRPAERRRDHRPRGDAGPRSLQPRPARAWTCRRSRSTGSLPREVTPPAPGATVEGAAYWQVQDDAARVWELTIQPRPKLKAGQAAQVVVDLRRRHHPARGHRGRALRLGHHAGRRHGRRRARGLDDLVPGERPPDRQGDLRLRDHRARGQGRGGQRAPGAGPGHRGRLDHLVLGRPRSPGQLPDHGLGRRLRPAPLRDRRRAADHRRRRRRPHRRQRRRHRGQPRPAGGHDRLPRGGVRAVPVQLLRLDRGRRHRRLRARDADPARLLPGRPRGHGRARARPPVVRERREPGAVAGHLAQRGLGHLRRVALERAPRAATRPRRASTTSWRSRPTTSSGTWRSPTRARSGCSSAAIYDRGAATLHALRVEVGDEAFFAGARSGSSATTTRPATTEDFEAVYEEVSGQDLGAFFDTWVRTPTKPAA